MNKDIKVKKVKTTYDVDEVDGSVYCYKSVVFSIFGEEKHFYGEGITYCAKGNFFNLSFGKAMAEIRAAQEIFKQLEIALIKYSFDHFLEVETPTGFLSGIILGKSNPVGEWVIM